ncbi:S-adenosylmethionine:tRNA ribosyltransferase-isomerase [Kitasatospora sp. NPDC048296]|uniref:S-adenosylmethionine:tRNA ribosyltransferase-isomerase n=1 Tax=Kitasatospora sp. NPDC048296 TaxID=3364048 RepID=UPI003723EC7F
MTALTGLGLGPTVPPELSARAPAEARGGARDGVRMLVGRRASGDIEHRRFTELPEVLRPGDLLVVNNSATPPWVSAGPARRSARAGGTMIPRQSGPAPRRAGMRSRCRFRGAAQASRVCATWWVSRYSRTAVISPFSTVNTPRQ